MADSREASTPPSDGKKRAKRFWAIVSFLAVLTALAVDERDRFQWLKGVDENVADAINSVSIGSIYDDYAERFRMCKYHWLVICEASTPEYGSFSLPGPSSDSTTASFVSYVVAAVIAMPKVPDATVYALHKRWAETPRAGPGPFAMAVIFIMLCTVGVLGYLQNRENLVGVLFVPPIILFALWLLKHVLLLFANGVGLVLEALIILGGVPALVAAAISTYHASREVREGAASVVKSFKE